MDAALAYRNLSCHLEERAEGEDSPPAMRAKLATETPVREFDISRGRIIPQVLISTGFRTEKGDNRVPLLDSHDRYTIDAVLGSVRGLKSEKGAVVGTLHFDEGERGQDARAKVEAGHLTDVSVGFQVDKKRYIEPNASKRIGGRTFKAGPDGLNVATQWTAKEGSLTPIGADHAAQVMRSWQNQTQSTKRQMEPETTTTEEETRSAATTGHEDHAEATERAEEKRHEGIERLAEMCGIGDEDVILAKVGGDSVEKFRKFAYAELQKRKEAREKDESFRALNAPLGFSEDERAAYSINQAVTLMAVGREGRFGSAALEGVARDAHQELAKHYKRALGEDPDPKALLIPFDFAHARSAAALTRRTMATTPDTDGGHLIATELRSIIEYCREMLVMGRVGANFLTGLQGNLKWPRHTNELTATWPGEQGATTPGSLTFGELTMSPKRVTAETDYTLMLMTQSSEDVERMNRREIAAAIATAIDRAALYGDGSAGNPTGLMNAAGTQPLTFGTGAPTWANVLKFDQLLEESNCPGSENVNSAGWLMSSNCKKVWLSTPKAAGEGLGFLADPPVGRFNSPTANGANIEHHNNAGLGEKVIKGVWEHLMVGLWGSLQLVVDPYTAASNGRTRVVASAFADVGVRHAAAFVISTDNGDGSNA